MRYFISWLRIFVQNAWLLYIAHFIWIQPSQYIPAKLVTPLGLIAFFSLLGVSAHGWDTIPFYLVGNAIQLVSWNGIYGAAMSIGRDRTEGVLLYVIGTPANRLTTYLGRSVFHILDGMISAILGFVLATVLLKTDIFLTNGFSFLLIAFVTALSTCGLGILLGTLAFITPHNWFIINTVFYLLLLLSGANIPINTLPTWMQNLGQVLPLSHGVAAARLIVEGDTLISVLPLLTTELLVGSVYAILGYFVFRQVESLARKHGTFELL